MAIATYSTDLTTMDAAASATGWAEATASGWTSVFAVTGGETDDYIQNTTCNSTTVKTGVGALLYDNAAGITLNQDDAVLVWIKWDVYPSLDTEANGGIRTVMGNALNAFYAFKHLGSDSYIYDGWTNLATGDPADATITPDYTVGTPTTTKQFHGWAFNALSVPSKGNPYKVDAIRYGRCAIITINGDGTAYGTFADMAQENDYNDGTNGYNRWGLFRKTSTDNYLWKGLMTLGNATVVDFRDSNATIQIDNTKHVTPAFNKIEVNNATSRVDWTGVTFSALGTVSRGSFEAIDDATINLDTCIFNDMLTFTFLGNTTINGCSFIRCDQIAMGTGTMDNSLVSANTNASAVLTADLADLTLNHFVGDGTGHAVELSSVGVGTMAWNNTFDTTTYATVDGSTGNEAIYVNVGTGTLTINVTSGATTPTIRTAGATVTVVAGAVTTIVTCVTTAGDPIQSARVLLRASDGTGDFPFRETVTLTRVGTTVSAAHTAHGMANSDKVQIRQAIEQEYNGVWTISNVTTNAYDYTIATTPTSPATGSIISTWVALEGLTDVNGEIEMSRVIATNQPVTGWGRKSSASPYYAQGGINGTIDNTLGFSATAALILDE